MCVCVCGGGSGSVVYLLFPFLVTSQFYLGYDDSTSILRNNLSTNHVFKDQQKNLTPTAPCVIKRLKKKVKKWNNNFIKGPNGRGAPEWKQSIKNIFVRLTQLDTDNPAERKQDWRKDLERAAAETKSKLRKERKTNKTHPRIYKLITKETRRKASPRVTWLREKAHAWLQYISVHREAREESWYPKQAIQVAHQIFLDGSGIKKCFKKFVNYLKNRTKRKKTVIADLLKKHEAAMGLY